MSYGRGNAPAPGEYMTFGSGKRVGAKKNKNPPVTTTIIIIIVSRKSRPFCPRTHDVRARLNPSHKRSLAKHPGNRVVESPSGAVKNLLARFYTHTQNIHYNNAMRVALYTRVYIYIYTCIYTYTHIYIYI